MKKQTYKKMTETIKKSPKLTRLVVFTDSFLTKISYVIYPLFMIYLLIKKEPAFWQVLLVPGVSFVVVSVFRAVYCAPRPYEVFGIAPIIDKDTYGKSFPSRHVFAIFIIAVTVFYFYPLPGIIIGLAGIIMAIVRVIGGVHFIKDVISGAAIGIACGIVGFYVIPVF